MTLCCSKYKKLVQKNNAMSAVKMLYEHAAATSCALLECHERCKHAAVGMLCGRYRDAVRTLYARFNWQI